MSDISLTRRAFLAATTTTATLTFTGAAAAPNTAEVVPGKVSPNEKLNVAAIGSGGKGLGDIMACKDENVVALCDVDWKRAEEATFRLPNAKRYNDYRNMLEELKEIDAVTISTPDHTHAPAAYMAMKLGKHVYVQKPLTHTVAEARLLANTAKEMNVITQMGNQGHSGDGARQVCEMVWSGAIGPVREAHVWTHRPVWANQGRPDPMEPQTTPEGLDWDRWLGAAPWRPYNKAYAPHDWRAWLDFGGGSLGDMACHIMDPVFWALKLVESTDYTVEVVMQEGRNTQTFPLVSTIKYSFPARGDMPPVDVYWYDGHWDKDTGEKTYNRPKRPAGVPDGQILGDGDMNGSFMIGDSGILTCGEYGGQARLMPDEKMLDYKFPDPTIPRIPDQDHAKNWLDSIKAGVQSCSNFAYAGPFTEMVQFGNLVVKSGQKLHWDNVKGVVMDVPDPAAIVSKEYRKGWEIPC
ncbi:MAG: Gfo/Idh/MocA family oxidoreductase [Candidatus Hydrogenedentes bacterium]|nr:Gfo/Idh/MocA family oxidoreductase [Candidatus Hydrogenedentota bacterium]